MKMVQKVELLEPHPQPPHYHFQLYIIPTHPDISLATQLLHQLILRQARISHQKHNQWKKIYMSRPNSKTHIKVKTMYPPKRNPTSHIEIFLRDSYLLECQDTEFKRTILNVIKEFKKFSRILQ